ncbi:MAG: hypothetical protein EAS48_08645, partial [Chryseobacterium sp.]
NSFYRALAKQSRNIQYLPKGRDDNGDPIYVAVYNPFPEKNIDKLPKDKAVLFVLNGIHPGEPDGIDATMMLMRDLAEGRITAPKNTVVTAISSYNVSGMQNRGAFSRADQNGPEQYGFRGNARNQNLNRDFIKADTKNARSFQEIYQWLQPDVMIDNHVSNGADYQYVFTYISSFKARVGKLLGDYFYNSFQRRNLDEMKKHGYESTQYVNIHGDVPDIGFAAYEDSPRYSTGYATLFNALGTTTETHMLKPYPQRVDATYQYMLTSLRNLDENTAQIKKLRRENLKEYLPGKQYGIRWKIDSTKYEMKDFLGYEARYKPSDISGQTRLYYDRNRPFTKKVKVFNSADAVATVSIPKYYVVPRSEHRVLEELQRNKIAVQPLKRDTVITVEAYKIADFKTVKNPFEGHYLHYDTHVDKQRLQKKFRAGDYLVPLQQDGVKYLLETLEPEATDSFWNWNFFDAILDQKEYYSAYIFEDTAAELLKTDAKLRGEFEAKKSVDAAFAKDGRAQLDWLYRHSPYFESSTYRQYPIYRIL